MNFTTCDLCDAHEDQLAAGTLKVFGDNVPVRSTLEAPGSCRTDPR